MKNVPQGWKQVTLGEATAATRLGGNYECNGTHTGIPVVKMGNLGRGRIQLATVERMPEVADYYSDDVLKRGDILFNTRNTLDLVGKVAMWREELPQAVFNSNILRIDFDENRGFTKGFGNLVLNSHRAIIQLRAIATGTTSVAAIYWRDAQHIRLLRPPLEEQRNISSIIETWDEAILKLESLIASKVERKRGLMQQLVTGQTRFKEFKGEKWRTYRLGDLLQEVDRYVTFDDEHTYRLASIRRRSEGFFFREALQGKDIKTKVMKSIHTGDFVLSKMQVVHGAWGLVTDEFDGMFVSDSYIALVPLDAKKLKIEFLNYLSQTRRLRHLAYLACHGVHIEKMTFNLEDFFHEKITIPPTIEEQARIVAVLSACDEEIRLLQKQLEALKEQKRGLMQKLLTGEVRVKI